jgi:MYXO-CTERM domain-containing protein
LSRPSSRLIPVFTQFRDENGALLRDKRVVTVTVTADIAGLAESPAPTTLEVPVDCGAIQWTSENDFTNEGTPGTPTATDGTGATTPASSGGAGGCSAAPGPSSSRNAAGLLAGVFALVAGLRRRQRKAQPARG